MSSLGVMVTFRRVGGNPKELRRMEAAFRPANLNPIVGRSAVNTFREHFFGLNQSRPNKLGGRRTGFYAQAARSTSSVATETGAIVSVNKEGIRQRLNGGEIKPGPGRQWISIPAIASAHGKLAREFNDLRFVLIRAAGNALAALKRVTGRTRERIDEAGNVTGGGEILGTVVYWLKKSVTQKPDASVLPYDELVQSRIERDVSSYVTRRLGGSIT
jgi:hypothetical protein